MDCFPTFVLLFCKIGEHFMYCGVNDPCASGHECEEGQKRNAAAVQGARRKQRGQQEAPRMLRHARDREKRERDNVAQGQVRGMREGRPEEAGTRHCAQGSAM
jgi:hypothetical protein